MPAKGKVEITFAGFCVIIGATLSRVPRMKRLRSQEWFARQDKSGFIYRSWLKNQGWPHDLFEGRPVIGICNTCVTSLVDGKVEYTEEPLEPPSQGAVLLCCAKPAGCVTLALSEDAKNV